MRYYFHLESESTIQLDHCGREFDWCQDAMEYAAALARDLAGEDKWQGFTVRVIDECNTEILCVPVVDAVT